MAKRRENQNCSSNYLLCNQANDERDLVRPPDHHHHHHHHTPSSILSHGSATFPRRASIRNPGWLSS